MYLHSHPFHLYRRASQDGPGQATNPALQQQSGTESQVPALDIKGPLHNAEVWVCSGGGQGCVVCWCVWFLCPVRSVCALA